MPNNRQNQLPEYIGLAIQIFGPRNPKQKQANIWWTRSQWKNKTKTCIRDFYHIQIFAQNRRAFFVWFRGVAGSRPNRRRSCNLCLALRVLKGRETPLPQHSGNHSKTDIMKFALVVVALTATAVSATTFLDVVGDNWMRFIEITSNNFSQKPILRFQETSFIFQV